MTAKQALLELILELSKDDAQKLLEYGRDFCDDEPLSNEEREELFRIRAEMEAGDAVPWPDVKRQLNL